MMGLDPVTIALIAGTAATVQQGQQQSKATKAAGAQAAEASKMQADQAEQQFNRQNMKRPDVGAIMASNTLSAKGGNAGTMLTGPGGVDPNALQLQKNTLLGE
jgi:hypothetical protein